MLRVYTLGGSSCKVNTKYSGLELAYVDRVYRVLLGGGTSCRDCIHWAWLMLRVYTLGVAHVESVYAVYWSGDSTYREWV